MILKGLIRDAGSLMEPTGWVMKITGSARSTASPADAAESAQVAGARMVVLSHLVPPLPGKFLHPAFLGDARSRFAGELIIGEDGMMFSLPANSADIDQIMLM